LKSAAGLKRQDGVSEFAIVWVTLNAHSAGCDITNSKAIGAFKRFKFRDELALAQSSLRSLAQSVRSGNILTGKNHLQPLGFWFICKQRCSNELGWFEYLSGDGDGAVKLLAKGRLHKQTGQAKALTLYTAARS